MSIPLELNLPRMRVPPELNLPRMRVPPGTESAQDEGPLGTVLPRMRVLPELNLPRRRVPPELNLPRMRVPSGTESATARSWSSSLQNYKKSVQSTVLEQSELNKKASLAKHKEMTVFSSWRAEEAENGD